MGGGYPASHSQVPMERGPFGGVGMSVKQKTRHSRGPGATNTMVTTKKQEAPSPDRLAQASRGAVGRSGGSPGARPK